MTINLVNGFVLISHPANWGTPPTAKRVWDTEIAESLPGDETRQALRAVPRRQISFTVPDNDSLQELSRLEARIDAATLSGLACAPMHGRGCVLGTTANAGTDSLALAATAWTWAVGDYAILIANDQTFDVQQVTGLSNGGLTLALAGNLANKWIAGVNVWPVIFGAFTSEKQNVMNAQFAQIKITVAELTSSRAVQLGILPAAPPGVGAQVIGSTNTIG